MSARRRSAKRPAAKRLARTASKRPARRPAEPQFKLVRRLTMHQKMAAIRRYEPISASWIERIVNAIYDKLVVEQAPR